MASKLIYMNYGHNSNVIKSTIVRFWSHRFFKAVLKRSLLSVCVVYSKALKDSRWLLSVMMLECRSSLTEQSIHCLTDPWSSLPLPAVPTPVTPQSCWEQVHVCPQGCHLHLHVTWSTCCCFFLCNTKR